MTKDEGIRHSSPSFVIGDEMLHIRLLGTPTIERNGRPLPPFKSRKVLALLAYLALNPRAHSRSHLAGLVWSDCPERKALDNLRFALWNLNEVLGTRVFQADRISVAWRANAELTLDTDEFTRLIQAGESSPHVWQRLVELYRGDVLAGFELPNDVLFNEWLQRERTRLREHALDALYRLAQFHLAQCHWSDAIHTLRRLLEFDPWREEAHRLLMLALAHNGQRTAALAQFGVCKRMLATELGVPPSAETLRLYERIRRAENLPRHNLPPSFTPFVGRAQELAEVLARLNQPECRLLTLVGAGGIGKTRLALAVAAACTERFLHGVRWIALEDIHTPEQFLPAIAAALDLTLRNSNPLEALSDFLREQEMLLVLDNVEQLRAAAGVLTDLLRRAPDVKILATSRERLNLQSEWVYALEGLPFPRETRDDPATFAAVQLFVQAAQRLEHHFVLDASNAPAIVRICQLVEGLPLGIELAATLDIDHAAIARALERDVIALATSMPDVSLRHRSLSAAFEHSWRLLADGERAVWRRLAVFRGGFDKRAATSIAQATPYTLDALARQSLVQLRAPRYTMLETLRQFAEEKLRAVPVEAEQTHLAHARYYADVLFARQMDLRLGKPDALAQVGAEIHNIRAAWEWAIEHARLDVLARAADGLGNFLEARSWTLEGAMLFARAHDLAARAPAEASDVTGARLLAWEGLFALRSSDFTRAQTLLETSRARFDAADVLGEQAFALNYLGLVAERLGQREQAMAHLEASVACARVAEDDFGCARALNNLGWLFYIAGDAPRAQALLEQALAIRRRLGDQPGIAKTLINVGSVANQLRQYAHARAAHRQALEIFQAIGNRLGQAVCFNNLGYTAFCEENYTDARSFYEQALTIYRDLGDRWGIATALDNLGATVTEVGDYIAAQAYYAEALEVAREIHATRRLVEVVVGLGRLAARQGNLTRAVEWLTFALNHPALGAEAREAATRLLAELETKLPRAEFDAAVARGKALDVEAPTAFVWGRASALVRAVD